ncbi:hypothetical protein GORHZ_011_00320 [Gordonia rhizosphera NBRC 16068]|uniref:Uncharacterized protein n=1 Tax=Gordonia rhizosphera NBRC 16068 TaxID=1108045 RepID=K6VMZ2_9ACTN|nr:hypothetical protein GORHZ_011_00320 [Gordonia rhizosphera NBRC 16068]
MPPAARPVSAVVTTAHAIAVGASGPGPRVCLDPDQHQRAVTMGRELGVDHPTTSDSQAFHSILTTRNAYSFRVQSSQTKSIEGQGVTGFILACG